MINLFEKLGEEEINILYRTPLLVAILVAGADDNIDKREIKEAVNLSRIKQTKSRILLKDFFQKAAENFEQKLNEEIASLPSHAQKRKSVIIAELEKLNMILPGYDRKFAIQFYESMKDIANKIATASGGILVYLTVDYEESRLKELRMIRNPANLKQN